MDRWLLATLLATGLAVLFFGCGGSLVTPSETSAVITDRVVFGFNELGMHCLNRNYSKLMILPPFNTLRAQAVRRAAEPHVVTSGAQVTYTIPGNTRSTGKTNFWGYEDKLFGFSLRPNTGLAGTRLSGALRATGDGRYEATGIPLTPLMDDGTLNTYPLATITLKEAGVTKAVTTAVLPLSWEIRCNLCHRAPDGAEMDILRAHDRRHSTRLTTATPVACGKCHLQPPLAAVLPGSPALPTLSRAMHGTHASRMSQISLTVACYACHPGVKTRCLRDVHQSEGMTCLSCHGSMTAVGSPARTPWVDEPRCGSCHQRSGFRFEESGKLFRESRGHNGIYCTSCHNTPHATVPTTNPEDNVQNIGLQGHAGTIDTCTVCHTRTPGEAFNHTLED